MAATFTVSERWAGRKRSGGNSRTATIEYIVEQDYDEQFPNATSDEKEAITALLDSAPDQWPINDSPLDNLPRACYDVEQISDRLWLGTVNYNHNEKVEDKFEYSFEMGGGTQKITQTISPMQVTKYGANAPDFQGAINVDDNSVNGVDIIVPVFNFTETRIVKSLNIDNAFKLSLFNLVGKVNASGWHGFAAGEVLQAGVSGAKSGRFGDWEITYKFAASPNKTNITIGTIAGINKKGWEYLWVRYEKSTDQNCLIQIPRAVYVHQLYESGDFSLLGLGD
ncbi:MAG: hypothetical protein A2Y12_01390 [Planctomycetes bacterium GWF2_42_9]|nr:MAG: hypothetical protein A2Y12_01390 [Planctomycetes bacterium GWF2_42_9]